MSPSTEDLLLFRAHARILLILIAIAWTTHFLNWGIFGGGLNWAFGRRSRHPWGLVCIAFSPFLHADTNHLTGNSTAFLILGWFVLLQGVHLFYAVTIGTALIGGFLAWLFGRENTVSVGASGVIYGYVGFLLIYGITAGNFAASLIALIVGFLYRRVFVGSEYSPSGMLPGINPRLGWRAHLFGFIAGVFMAYLLSGLRLG